MITATAPGKVILFGEHAVVYGQPAIAVPVSSLRAMATVEPGTINQGLSIVAQDLDATLHIEDLSEPVEDSLVHAVRLLLDHLGCPIPYATIRIQSQIPIASGLGSGAAVTAALMRALAAVVNRMLDDETLNGLVYEVEKIHHGTPSGIDNTVIVYEQPVYFVRGAAIETIAVAESFTLVVGDSGKASLTKTAVGDVGRLYEVNPDRIQPILDAIGRITVQARQHIAEGTINALGRLMVENHDYLRELTVSSPELDALVQAALDAGALGAKLSGGGRGGNMIALVNEKSRAQVKQALLNAGAVRVLETVVNQV